jgi:hypothetical protein
MDPYLHLALLDNASNDEVVKEVRRLPWDRRSERYNDLLAAAVPDGVSKVEWTDRAAFSAAVPDGMDGRIRALAGIERHQQLQKVYLERSEVEDLTPLTKLPALELLWVNVADGVELSPLLACERLKRHIDRFGPRWTASRRCETSKSCGSTGRRRTFRMGWPPSCGNGASSCI